MRPIRVRIDSAALRHNLGAARRRAPRSRICAVVKANAYGHGLARAARAFAAAEGLALIELEAALELRRAGERRPMLLLQGFFSPEELEPIAAHGLTTVVHDPEQLAMLEKARLPGRIAVVAKLNTGLNRLGFRAEDLRGVLDRLRNCSSAGAVALMTHFADADGKRGVRWQLERFEAATTGVDLPRSLANSAALLRYPESHKDWVRPGIMLYGCSPFPDESAEALGLKPAMTLASELIAVRDLRPGDSVGYGGTYTASGTMRIGIVACGYADGYPRHAPTGTPILVCGRRTRTLGRVAMDMLFADLTGIPEAAVGSPVTLWGEGLSADEVAASAGTVSYELLCALTPRVPVAETP
ncbi:MAG: alanine racemase [Betaproteobacteria bacterium]|nr:MAG: alanine racemase [Betaproteobacteria bacterium]